MTTTTATPVTATAFYERAQPLVEQLVTMARGWRDVAPTDEQAIAAHVACFRLALHVDLCLSRCRRAAGVEAT